MAMRRKKARNTRALRPSKVAPRRAKAARRRSSRAKSGSPDATVNALVLLVVIAIAIAAYYLYSLNKKTSLIDTGTALATLAPYSSGSVVK